MVGGAFEKAAESRGGEISEEADGENWKPRPDEKPFFIFREQRSRNESKKPGSAVFPPLSSKIDSFLKKRKKDSQTLPHFRSKTIVIDLRIVGSKMGRICERKKKEKKEGGG